MLRTTVRVLSVSFVCSWAVPEGASAQTFTNATPIAIPASGSGDPTTGAPATPYPSNITVSGLTTAIGRVSIRLNV